MNCPTRDTNPSGYEGFNQNPPYLAPELTTRASLVCGGKSDGAYNLPLHVLALFIILFQSILSCSFPLLVKKFPAVRVPQHFLFLSRHFGTGVLIATAFVHLLPTAFTSLTDPCLPEFWNKSYPAMAGLIAMISVFVVVTIEMVFSTMNGGSMGGCHSAAPLTGGGTTPSHSRSNSAVIPMIHEEDADGSVISMMPTRPTRHRRSASIGKQLQKIERDSLDLDILLPTPTTAGGSEADVEDSDSDDSTNQETRALTGGPARGAAVRRPRSMSATSIRPQRIGSRLTEAQQQQKNLLQVMLLEAGILFHSVFIGMALSVATGSNFIVLLIAITFHQTFEGLALGSRIASLSVFPKNSPKPWLMCLAYGTTTPIGQAIGLATRKLYDPASQTGLLMVGVMNAISSGLLLFAGLVELLAEDFLSDESYVILSGKRRIQACGAVAAGGMGMALIGAWA